MAIYHLSEQSVGKSSGRSPMAMAAYRAADKLEEMVIDSSIQITSSVIHDYSRKGHVIHSEIVAPANAPEWAYNRQSLWQKVIESEKRIDATYLQEMNVAIPVEFNKEQSIALVRDYVDRSLVSKGMVVDFSIHWEKGNPHAHIMQTTRNLNGEVFGNKNRDWHRKEGLVAKRETWAKITNEHLARNGFDVCIDHRSYKAQGIDLTPTIHEGIIGDQLEMRNIQSELRQHNIQVANENTQKIEGSPEILLKKVSQGRATFTKRDIANQLFKVTRGDEEAFSRILPKVMASKLLIEVKKEDLSGTQRFAYKEYVEIEKGLFKDVAILAHPKEENILSEKDEKQIQAISEKNSLGNEQINAFKEIVKPDQDIAVLMGRAGTGKTRTLGSITEYYKSKGMVVEGAALAGVAASKLGEETGINARTIASMKFALTKQKGSGIGTAFDKADVLLVDEAGMIGTEDMAFILSYARDTGTKVVLVGDTQQFSAIEAGAAFRGIIEKVGYSELTEVRRQKDGWQQKATKDFSRDRVDEGLTAYNAHGKIKWSDTAKEAKEAIVKDYIAECLKNPEKSQIALSYRKSDIAALNLAIREKLKEAGKLGKERIFSTNDGQKAFAIGDRLIFLRNEYKEMDVRNGMTGTITGIGWGGLTVKIDGVDKQREVRIDNARYTDFSYGYALTAYKSQGVTVDRSYVLADRIFNAESAYVALSRHKEDMKLYADKETFNNLSGLIKEFSQIGGKDLVSDYEVTAQMQPYHKRVSSYIEKAGKAYTLLGEMATWSKENFRAITQHEKWKEFRIVQKGRNDLAKQIVANFPAHKRFLREGRIYLETLRKHAGIKQVELDPTNKLNPVGHVEKREILPTPVLNPETLLDRCKGMKNPQEVYKVLSPVIDAYKECLKEEKAYKWLTKQEGKFLPDKKSILQKGHTLALRKERRENIKIFSGILKKAFSGFTDTVLKKAKLADILSFKEKGILPIGKSFRTYKEAQFGFSQLNKSDTAERVYTKLKPIITVYQKMRENLDTYNSIKKEFFTSQDAITTFEKNEKNYLKHLAEERKQVNLLAKEVLHNPAPIIDKINNGNEKEKGSLTDLIMKLPLNGQKSFGIKDKARIVAEHKQGLLKAAISEVLRIEKRMNHEKEQWDYHKKSLTKSQELLKSFSEPRHRQLAKKMSGYKEQLQKSFNGLNMNKLREKYPQEIKKLEDVGIVKEKERSMKLGISI